MKAKEQLQIVTETAARQLRATTEKSATAPQIDLPTVALAKVGYNFVQQTPPRRTSAILAHFAPAFFGFPLHSVLFLFASRKIFSTIFV